MPTSPRRQGESLHALAHRGPPCNPARRGGQARACLRNVVEAGLVQLGLAHFDEIEEEPRIAGYEVDQLVDWELQHLRLLLGDIVPVVRQAG